MLHYNIAIISRLQRYNKKNIILFINPLYVNAAGLTYDEAPENVYSEVGVSNFNIYGREIFANQMWAKNWNKWVDNTILNSNSLSWGFKITQESNQDAPGGILYVINVNCSTKAKYTTPNNGYLFAASKFSGNYELENPSTTMIENKNESTSRVVYLPVKKQETSYYQQEYHNSK